jgi:cation diffusion facilitator CzcD-associated flavoprotein CzcO
VGTISIPQDCTNPGVDKYRGTIWHSARWNHGYDLHGKSVAVVGNGCSAAQLVPFVVKDAAKVTQFQRCAQWINDRPNREFSAFEKWCFRYVPLANKLYRFYIWKITDALHTLYASESARSIKARAAATEVAREYMRDTAPERYHDILIPKFPLGCKRRIFDPGYLESLHSPKIELTTEAILEFTETRLKTSKQSIDFDVVILSTGFKIQEFLSPIVIRGESGITLNEHWKATRGAQAYKSTFVAGFPNFGIVFGPNAFPAHNSVIFTNEVQVEYIIKTMFRPMIQGSFTVSNVKEAAENRDARHIQSKLQSMVWSSGCSNWNLDKHGRNTTNYHDNTYKFWYQLPWPVWRDFDLSGGTGYLPWRPEWKRAGAVLDLGVLTSFVTTGQLQFLWLLMCHTGLSLINKYGT